MQFTTLYFHSIGKTVFDGSNAQIGNTVSLYHVLMLEYTGMPLIQTRTTTLQEVHFIVLSLYTAQQ